MKIAVVGFGAASIGFLERMKETEHEFHVFEKSKDIYSSSISGIRADGKLFVSTEMGGDLPIDTKLQKQFVDFYINHSGNNDFETGKSFDNDEYYNAFYEKGFLPVASDFYHLGTDQLKQVLHNIYNNLSSYKNIRFRFNEKVTEVHFREGKVAINASDMFDKALISVGRSGHQLVKSIIQEYPDLVADNTNVDFGIRYELPDRIVSKLNEEMYEFKLKYKSKTGYMVRTFCNNPSGFVVTENYDDFCSVNGHAKLKEKSKNTNFAVLTTIKLTQPFNDPISYGTYIAKLANLLAGKDRVILQTYDHFKQSKRTKNLYRVLPTLDASKYILGDINLALPRRIIESIIDFIENLETVVPGMAHPDNLVYAPEVKFYSNKINNDIFSQLKFAGDCSGLTRSIIYATSHGYLIAGEFLN